ncbi:MAG: PEP-CTERM sorting domain-containing protein [Phycisphaeraceae bacterium]
MFETKKCLAGLAVAGLTLAAGPALAQAVVYDGFDYASTLVSGDNINGADGGVGWAGPWVNTRNSPDYVEPGNTDGSLPVVGGKVQGNAWSGIARPLGTTLADANLLDDGATLWFSVIFDLAGANTTNADLNFALTNAEKFDSGTFGNRENLDGASNEGIGITHSRANIEAVYWDNLGGRTEFDSSLTMSGNGLTGPQTALIVGKIEWGVGSADETITLYNPDTSGSEPVLGTEILAATAIPALDQSTFDTLALQFKDTPRMDEIRFAASFEEVVGGTGTPVIPGDTDGDGDIDDSDLGTAFSNYTGPLAPGTGGKTAADGDTDGDGDVDDSDLGTAFSGYTGPLGPAAVPEPTSLALLGLGGLLIARRRRG